jgi:hypothetical protein
MSIQAAYGKSICQYESGSPFGVADRATLVGHVGHVGAAEQERQRPEGGQQAGHRQHRHQVAGALAVRPEDEQQQGGDRGEDADDQVAEDRQAKSPAEGRPFPVRMPRASTPRYSIDMHRARLKENSPPSSTPRCRRRS